MCLEALWVFVGRELSMIFKINMEGIEGDGEGF